ncbi:MAG: Por secretion system C-terminal sorting protein [Gammaproteobacteria bacterium]|jgi:hypothetical protein|nr:Por secretion system C-terminal sorting protein [Gammaproteobacteria bacterium]
MNGMKKLLLLSTLIYAVNADSSTLATPKKLLVYYGWPSVINGCAGNTTCASDVFSQYDVVILGDTLEFHTHGDYENARTIIANTPNTKFYGYISLANPAIVSGSSHTGLDALDDDVDDWRTVGVAGIFLDEFGYDYQVDGGANYVSRERQNAAVDYIHSKNLPVIANAWIPSDVFDTLPGAHDNNPSGIAASIGDVNSLKDHYFWESYQYTSSPQGYVAANTWRAKANSLHQYLNQAAFSNVGLFAVTTSNNDDQATQALNYAWYSAFLDQIEAVGWGEPDFAASSATVTIFTWPSISNPGSSFTTTTKVSPFNAAVYNANTNTGAALVNTTQHTGNFYANKHAIQVIPTQSQMNLSRWPSAGTVCNNNQLAPTAISITTSEAGYSTPLTWSFTGNRYCITPPVNFSNFAANGTVSYSTQSSNALQYTLNKNCSTLFSNSLLLCPL